MSPKRRAHGPAAAWANMPASDRKAAMLPVQQARKAAAAKRREERLAAVREQVEELGLEAWWDFVLRDRPYLVDKPERRLEVAKRARDRWKAGRGA